MTAWRGRLSGARGVCVLGSGVVAALAWTLGAPGSMGRAAQAAPAATRREALRTADSALNVIELRSQGGSSIVEESMDVEAGIYEAPTYRGSRFGDEDGDAVYVQGNEDEEDENMTVRSSGACGNANSDLRASSPVPGPVPGPGPGPGPIPVNPPLRRQWGAAA